MFSFESLCCDSLRPFSSSVAFLMESTLLTQKRLGMSRARGLHLLVWRAPMKCQRIGWEAVGGVSGCCPRYEGFYLLKKRG